MLHSQTQVVFWKEGSIHPDQLGVPTYKKAGRQTNMQADRERQTDRQTDMAIACEKVSAYVVRNRLLAIV